MFCMEAIRTQITFLNEPFEFLILKFKPFISREWPPPLQRVPGSSSAWLISNRFAFVRPKRNVESDSYCQNHTVTILPCHHTVRFASAHVRVCYSSGRFQIVHSKFTMASLPVEDFYLIVSAWYTKTDATDRAGRLKGAPVIHWQ